LALGLWVISSLFIVVQLAACGSGGGSLADGGIGGTGIVAAGAITAKGSIFVNGIEFSVAGASFERDGSVETLTEEEQVTRVGMVLEVEGELNEDGLTGKASEIRFKDLVEGKIENATTGTPGIKVLTILAQQVIVEDGLTIFEPPHDLNFANIHDNVGFLEVSGFRRADNAIQASYIELKQAENYEITGVVSAVNAASLSIGDLTVTGDLTQLQAGDTIRVEGSNYDEETQTLSADSLQLQQSGLSVENAAQAEIEGFISGASVTVLPNVTFKVAGQDVRYTASTRFSGGTAEELLNNAKVEVEGPLIGGTLIADEISFDDNLKLQGTVTAVSINSLTVTFPDDLAGSHPVEVTVDPTLTEQDPRLEEIAAGDYVRLEGQLSESGMVLASRLRELDPDTRIILQAPVESFNATTGFISILGVAIDTNGLSLAENDIPLTQTDFFRALQTSSGILVKARSDLPGQWEELELER
jgi:hypothetical protein